MFKRRDWVYTHNPDTGDVTSDSDTEGGFEIASDEGTSDAASVDEDHDASGEASDGGSADEAARPMRMEDLQEMLESDDADDDDDANAAYAAADAARPKGAAVIGTDPAAIEKQKAEWLQAPEGIVVKGVPLRCLLCKYKLLVNSCGFQCHMKSKAHLAAAKRHGLLSDPLEQLDSVVAAATCRHETEETETHRERVERFQQIANKLKLKKQAQISEPTKKPKQKGKKGKHVNQVENGISTRNELQAGSPVVVKKRKRGGSNRLEKSKRKKPGRRQRIEAKATAAAK